MGEMAWVLAIGGAIMWAPLLWAVYQRIFHPQPDDLDACPACGHEIGLDERRRHCAGQDDHNGWSSDLCKCQNDWHWRYESVRTQA